MNNDVEQASGTRDTLAQQLYERCFHFIVCRLNAELGAATSGAVRSIFLLDMFGFESFKVNSFEQLCINYANEKLQLLFNDYMFRFEMDEYVSEGINTINISYRNNQPCLDLFEQKPLGINRILDEECRFPKATDASFLDKLEANHDRPNTIPEDGHFVRQRFKGDEFGVRHYCGTVTYTVAGFLAKNRQNFSQNLSNLVVGSKSVFVAHLFDDVIAASGTGQSSNNPQSVRSVQRPPTLIIQFQDSLSDLIARLTDSDPHFIRCIKSNSRNAPNTFDAPMIAGQLRDIGIVEAIRIRSEGYPQRHSFDSLLGRYGTLGPKARDPNITNKQQVHNVLEYLGIEFPSELVQIGATKVFFKASVHERLETLVGCVFAEMATVLQRHVRGLLQRKRYQATRRSAMKLQQSFRRYFAVLKANIVIQSRWRGIMIRRRRLLDRRSVNTSPSSDIAMKEVADPDPIIPTPSLNVSVDVGETSPVPDPVEDNPLPELDGVPIEARSLVKMAFDDQRDNDDLRALIIAVQKRAINDPLYAASIGRSRHLRHIVLILGTDVASLELLGSVARSVGHVSRFVNSGGLLKVKEAIFSSCSQPTMFDNGEAEAAVGILAQIVSMPFGAESVAHDDDVIKSVTICLYCRPNDVRLAAACASLLAELVCRYDPATDVLIRLGGIEAVIQAWAFHENTGSDPSVGGIYRSIVRILTHPLVLGNPGALDIVAELTASPIDIAIHGLSSSDKGCADPAASLALALIAVYPSLADKFVSVPIITAMLQHVTQASPPDPAKNLIRLFQQICTPHCLSDSGNVLSAAVKFVRRYASAGDTGSSTIGLEFVVQMMPAGAIQEGCERNKGDGEGGTGAIPARLAAQVALAAAECLEGAPCDSRVGMSSQQLLSLPVTKDEIMYLMESIRNNQTGPSSLLQALTILSGLCSIPDRVKQIVDLGAINVFLLELQATSDCGNCSTPAACRHTLAIRGLARLLQFSWPAQVQFRQCSGFRYIKGTNPCCPNIVSANLSLVSALLRSTSRSDDAVNHLVYAHSLLHRYIPSSPALCFQLLTTIPGSVLFQVPQFPATLLSILSYHAGRDEQLSTAASRLIPLALRHASDPYPRSLCETLVTCATLCQDIPTCLGPCLAMIAQCVAFVSQNAPPQLLLTPDLFQLLLAVSEPTGPDTGNTLPDANRDSALELLAALVNVSVVAEVAATALRRQALDGILRPLSPASQSILLPSGAAGAASAIAYLALHEAAAVQLDELQVLSAIDGALYAAAACPESPEREQIAAALALALQRLSRHSRVRDAIRDSSLVRTLDIMLVQHWPHYPGFTERAMRCLKNLPPPPSNTPPNHVRKPTFSERGGSMNRFRNIFATVLNMGDSP